MTRQLVLLYHFFHPDDVISARLYSELGAAAAEAGWQVVALPANRSCHALRHRLPRRETWSGVQIRRIWRPAFSQSRTLGRLTNTLFMLLGWSWFALWHKRNPQEVVVIGTDPVFGTLAALPWRLFRPNSCIIHWCHDLHPEASLAEGAAREKSLAVRLLRWLLRRAYRRCDVLVDLGPCMRLALSKAAGVESSAQNTDQTARRPPESGPQSLTITPWSLVEPSAPPVADASIRQDLFGDAKLGLLYSGNLGRAHDYRLFVELARQCASGDATQAAFCFAGRGVGLESLKSELRTEDHNITFAGFASEAILEKRLSACDVHLVSLKENWTGTVVPSKFFGALAMGRPVLFVGAGDSAIAQWIREYNVGWLLCRENLHDVARRLQELAEHPEQLLELNQRCWQTYHDHFSRQKQLDRWLELLNAQTQVR